MHGLYGQIAGHGATSVENIWVVGVGVVTAVKVVVQYHYYNSDMVEEGAVEQDDGHFMGPSKNLRGKGISTGEALMATSYPTQIILNRQLSTLTFKQLGLGEEAICSIVNETESTATVGSPQKKA
ncbi:hypothetical protein Trydic_g245 [Trypoxylus dichotomus]